MAIYWICLYLSTGNGAERCKFFTQAFVIQAVIQIFHVEIDSLLKTR